MRILKVALRHALVHALNVVLYLFMAVLALAAGMLIFLLSRDDIPVPDFVIRRIETKLAEAGIEASFSRARLDLHGGVVIQNLKIEPARFHEPVIEAGLLVLNFDELFLAAGMIELTEARAENVTISCPSALSPTGTPYPIIRVAGFSLERVGRAWKVHGLVAESGPLVLAAHGTFTPPVSRDEPKPIVPSELVDLFARLAPQVARALSPLDTLQDPRIEASFEVSRSGEVRVAIEASASTWADSRIGEAHNIRLNTQVVIEDGKIPPVDIRVQVGSLVRGDGLRADALTGLVHWDQPIDVKRPMPTWITASAARLVHPKLEVETPSIRAQTHAFPEVHGNLAVRVAGEPLEVAFSGNLATRSGVAEARGRIGRDWLPEASRILGRDVTYYATIGQPPDFWTRARVGEGGVWQQAEFRALTGPIVARRVALDRARVHGMVTPQRASIDHLEISLGDEGARGTYDDDFATREHRLILRGTLRPLAISGWFSGWWERFWDDFTFDGGPPAFDVDAYGDWNNAGQDRVQGRGKAARGTMRGVAFESLETRFFIRPNYYDLHQMTVVRPEGRVSGEVQLQFRRGQRDAQRTRFNFISSADLVELARIFGKGGEELLAPYRYAIPPNTSVTGLVTNDAGDFDTTLAIGIESPAEFRYHDFPVSAISTDVRIHNSHVEIQRLVAGYAGGTLRASATADNGILAVKASLDDASYDDATSIFNAFLDRRSPPPPEEIEPAGLAARPPGGRLSLGVDARGPITTFDAYEGAGSLRITGANLGRVRIFGLLSDLMRTINSKLGSLTFTEATSTFEVRRDRVAFPDLRISGRTAALETEGTYYINSKNLDFRARLYPLGESGGAITQLFDFVLGPVSFLLELRLTGTLRKPNWSLSRMPFAPKPEVDEGTTPAPAGAAPTAPEAVAPQGSAASGIPTEKPASTPATDAPEVEDSTPLPAPADAPNDPSTQQKSPVTTTGHAGNDHDQG